MSQHSRMVLQREIVIVGAGVAGLAASIRLAGAGHRVKLLEAATQTGGKIRTLPSQAGPVDTGPTVLTMKPVFEALFADVGEDLCDHVTLRPLPLLARHYWSDGTCLDLPASEEDQFDEVARVFGSRAASELKEFTVRAHRLFDTFDRPMMQARQPTQLALTSLMLKNPGRIRDMAPHLSLAGALGKWFTDPRLAQLFARYSTYVGGLPKKVPALLSLIWSAEARGVWAVEGGMSALAAAMTGLAKTLGVKVLTDHPITKVEQQGARIVAVHGPTRVTGDVFVWAGDPGQLVDLAPKALPASAVMPKSLSADVLAFAATPSGPDLAYHTVFFGDDPEAEFTALAQDRRPDDATLYICAQDRAFQKPNGPERFEIIRNAPANATKEDPEECLNRIVTRLKTYGLTLSPNPKPNSLTQPSDWAKLFPGSQGAIYGRSPHGLTAGLKRPTARTAIPGLYLCGGGAHPGAGVPMATLSARHLAETIAMDLSSTLPSRQMATHGGISTGSAQTVNARSRSSPS